MAHSGSLKELSRAVNAFIPSPSLPLPDDLHQVIEAYLQKHEKYDEGSSTRLHDEFLAIYQKQVKDHPDRLPAFVSILRLLLPCVRLQAHIFQWWDILCRPIASNEQYDKGLAAASFEGMLEILMAHNPDAEQDGAENVSNPFLDRLLSVWLEKYNVAEAESSKANESTERRLRGTLITFGKRRPRTFLSSLDKYFVTKADRKRSLRLLCEFVQNQPPHLHQILHTPLFKNLLQCLQLDTSTTVISMALTSLIMLLPHMPSSLVPHLPTLFNIYARVLFWDQERTGAIEAPDAGDQRGPGMSSWEVCAYAPEYDDLSVPHLLNYYTVLYGLYPINFMDYIRKPQRYLRHANAPNADQIEVQPTEIRHKSERFRQSHLLHPNFYTLTIDSEKIDFGRWIKSGPAEVVAECMALCSTTAYPASDSHLTLPMPGAATPSGAEVFDRDGQDPALLSGSMVIDSHLEGWRFPLPATVGSPGSSRVQSTILRQNSQSSHPSNRDSLETRAREAGGDSPTLPPHLVPSPSHTQLQDMINSNKAIKSGFHQSLANDSVPSLSLSHHDSIPEKPSGLAAPTAMGISASTSLTDLGSQVSQLHRQILLLQNDLSFERYLKQQHMTHIGELRRRQVREAATEAEMQNLIMANRNLKHRLEDAKRAEVQARKESEKRQALAKNWEADLSTKLKVLREDSKKGKAEEDALRREVESTKRECEKLRKLLCDMEVKALNSQQSIQAIEINTAEIDRLKSEVERLKVSERDHQAKEMEREIAINTAAEAENRMEILSMKLTARETELQRTKKLFQAQIVMLNNKLLSSQEVERPRVNADINVMVESALAAGRARHAELQKQYSLLMRKYTMLHSSLLDMRVAPNMSPPKSVSFLDDGDVAEPAARSASPMNVRTRPHRVFSDPDTFEATSYNVTPALESQGSFGSRAATPALSSHGGSGSGTRGQPLRPSTPPGTEGLASGSGDVSPEQRYFGRGGVQNRIKKEGKVGKSAKEEEKKEKKPAGRLGIRGFN